MSRLRNRTLIVVAIAVAVLGLSAAAVYAGTHGNHGLSAPGAKKHGAHHGHGRHVGQGFPPNVQRFDLSGYKIETRYTLGRNTGNTFQQTYGADQVQGVPVAGPFVGTVFPPVDYVALPIARKTLYVAWLDPSTHAIVDAFVMNFKTGVVFDYAPDNKQHPESSGTVRVLQAGPKRLP